MKKRLSAVISLVLFLGAMVAPGSASSPSYDVVVIGAGGGGLSAAARISLSGMKVLLIEQHYKVGGYMTNFERGDYTFEVSLHAINGMDPHCGMTRRTFEELGIMDKIKPVRLLKPYRIVMPDFELDVPADPHEYMKLLKNRFPHENKGIDKFFRIVSSMEHAIVMQKAGKEGDGGRAMKLYLENPFFAVPMIKYANKSLADLLDDCVDDEKLKAVLSWMCGYGGAPPQQMPALLFMGMWADYHFGGFYYFEGGSQSISDALADVVRSNGGEVLLSTMAEKIVIKDGKAVAVRTGDGSEYACRYVVSNASAPATLFELTGEEHLPDNYVEQVKSMEIGPSAFQVYLGVDRDYTPDFNGAHTISVFESYELSSLVNSADPENQGYFIVNYSVADPTAAPQGKNVIVFTTYLPYDWKNGWHENESYMKYEKLKKETAMTFIKRAEKYLPGLSSHIEVMEVGSPRTMEHFTLNPQGAIYGWDINREQTFNKRLEQETPIENLYLAGAWTRPGHGQSAVLSSGIMAAEKIIENDGHKEHQ